MRRIGLLQTIRLNSQRVPRKLLAEVGGRRLIDSGLERLVAAGRVAGVPALACVCLEDVPLVEACQAWEVEVFERSRESRDHDDYDTVFADWAERLRDRFDWVVDGNFICRPFLRVETVLQIIDHAREAPGPFVTVRACRGLVWDGAGRPIVGVGRTADTRENPGYHVLNNLAYGLPVDYLGIGERLARDTTVWPMELAVEETLDVDTVAELEFARIYARGIACSGH